MRETLMISEVNVSDGKLHLPSFRVIHKIVFNHRLSKCTVTEDLTGYEIVNVTDVIEIDFSPLSLSTYLFHFTLRYEPDDVDVKITLLMIAGLVE